MKKKCINCGEPNKEGWFYCRSCGQKASEPFKTRNNVCWDKENN